MVQKKKSACFIAYMVQAVVNNFVPLLFVIFQQTYDIPMSFAVLMGTSRLLYGKYGENGNLGGNRISNLIIGRIGCLTKRRKTI